MKSIPKLLFSFLLLLLIAFSCAKVNEVNNSVMTYDLHRICDLHYTNCDSVVLELPNNYRKYISLSVESIKQNKFSYRFFQKHLNDFGAFNNQKNIFIREDFRSCLYMCEIDEAMTDTIGNEGLQSFVERRYLTNDSYVNVGCGTNDSKAVDGSFLKYKMGASHFLAVHKIESKVGDYMGFILSLEETDPRAKSVYKILKKNI